MLLLLSVRSCVRGWSQSGEGSTLCRHGTTCDFVCVYMDVFSVCSRWLKKKMCEGRLHMTHLHDASLSLRSNQQVTATPSGDATLPCQAPADTPTDLKLLKWSRPDVTSGYVYFHRDGRLLKEYQHPSYRGRVELSDPEMRNRDVSVVLRNVSNSDAGTYECLVSIKSEQTSRQYVRLTVTDEGHREGDAPAGNKRARIGKVGSTAAGGNKNGYVGLALCVVSALVL